MLQRWDLCSRTVHGFHNKWKLQSYILHCVSKLDKVPLVADDVVVVLLVLNCDLTIGCPGVFELALATELSTEEQQSIPELGLILISRYMFCLGVLLEFPGISQDMEFGIHWFEAGDYLAWTFSLGRRRIADSVRVDNVIRLKVDSCFWRCLKDLGSRVFSWGLLNARETNEGAPAILF